ncbi:18404_t:CDS:1, partial [Funneliformis geosporum]
SDNFPCLILFARYPNTSNCASMTLDFSEPFGPTIAENDEIKKFYD